MFFFMLSTWYSSMPYVHKRSCSLFCTYALNSYFIKLGDIMFTRMIVTNYLFTLLFTILSQSYNFVYHKYHQNLLPHSFVSHIFGFNFLNFNISVAWVCWCILYLIISSANDIIHLISHILINFRDLYAIVHI